VPPPRRTLEAEGVPVRVRVRVRLRLRLRLRVRLRLRLRLRLRVRVRVRVRGYLSAGKRSRDGGPRERGLAAPLVITPGPSRAAAGAGEEGPSLVRFEVGLRLGLLT